MEYAWQLFRYRLPLRRPLSLLGTQHAHREGLLLRLEDPEGYVGWGEVAPLPGLHRESLAICRQQLATVLVSHNKPTPSTAPSVRFGVDMAQRMLQAKRTHPTLQAWVHPRALRLPVNGLLTESEGDFKEACKRLSISGFRAVKVKLGQGTVEQAIKRVEAVRTALGSKVELRVDANRAWSWKQACRFAQGVQDADIAYCEEPLQDIERLAALHELTGLPLALDETLWQCPQWLTSSFPGLRALIVKPTVCGPWEASLRWMDYAQRHGLKVVFSSAFESGLGLLGIAVSALVDSPSLTPCGFDTYHWLAEDILTEPLQLKDGNLYLPQHWPKVLNGRLESIIEGKKAVSFASL